MSSDKEPKPLGLKITNFIVSNLFWYFIFSIIYWNIDCREWWLTQSNWGRFILVVIEFLIYGNSFIDGRKNKNIS